MALRMNVVQLSRIRSNRPLSFFSVRASATCDDRPRGPSCIYVGPLHSASKETLEALYSQARDAYYSGEPLIVDDMFDRVESVVKYPRCSIRRQSTYSDAEEDLSMALALACTWSLFLALGCSACVGPILYSHKNAFDSGLSYGSRASGLGLLFMVNSIIFMVLGLLIGYPVASASVKVLQGLWRNDLVALKGSCPNCGEEVFAFVRTDKANNNSPHRSDCHVCECLLEFRTKVEKQSVSRLGRQWVYGRIYLVRRSRRQREL
ncbi:uncharacterized protein LOC113855127 isoform X2 [Abrus precatorius]|uniref:Uncharacterized protein LOC113855127 isoform X2 n=1 Tax=Abrus precatorius TaxID=3816 RepID=A0A8B8KF44_ABRPR|nr:uncharacterized protein LOC113855127 isoform X2 [Abrus precatorius]